MRMDALSTEILEEAEECGFFEKTPPHYNCDILIDNDLQISHYNYFGSVSYGGQRFVVCGRAEGSPAWNKEDLASIVELSLAQLAYEGMINND